MTVPQLRGRITDASVIRRPVPLRRPLPSAPSAPSVRGTRGPLTSRAVRLLHLTAEDGFEGVGEGSSVDWLATASPAASSNALATTMRLLVDRIRREGLLATDLLEWSLESDAPAALRCAVQTALLDIEARRHGCSLAALLGGSDPCLPQPLSALLGDDEPLAMAREAEVLAGLGIDCFKMKIGQRRLSDDVKCVATVRRAIGEQAGLRLDANGAWTIEEARRAMTVLEPALAEFVEEPLQDANGTSTLAISTPVALDESIRDAGDLARAIDRGGFQTLVLKLERVGGPLPALAMAEQARGAGLEVVFTDSIESAVGRTATVHTAAAEAQRAGAAPRAVGLGGLFLLEDGDDPEAEIVVCGPGLGIEVDAVVGPTAR